MFTISRRVFGGLTRAALPQGPFIRDAISTMRLNSVRPLAQGSQRLNKVTEEEREVNQEPIKFTTSKASHRTWEVKRSMGGQYQRPWWKVLPLSLLITTFLLWCVFREETEIDEKLEQHLHELFPGLSTEDPNKPN